MKSTLTWRRGAIRAWGATRSWVTNPTDIPELYTVPGGIRNRLRRLLIRCQSDAETMASGTIASANNAGEPAKRTMLHRFLTMEAVTSTWTRTLSASDAAAFDAFVEGARGGCYAQARAWAEVAVAGRNFTPCWFLARRGSRVVGAALVLVARLPGLASLPLPAAIVERGPVVSDLDELRDVLGELRRQARRHGVLRIQTMPYWADAEAERAEQILTEAGFRSTQTMDGAHARTLRVDLGVPADQLYAGKAGESLRRKIRQASKAGAVARRGSPHDMVSLQALHDAMMGSQGRSQKAETYFRALANVVDDQGALFIVEVGGEAVSALFARAHGSIATFVVGATTSKPHDFSKMVPAMDAAIRWAKERGCLIFDLGGIPMEGDADPKRNGIAQFKLDFAKTPVRLVREHARWF